MWPRLWRHWGCDDDAGAAPMTDFAHVSVLRDEVVAHVPHSVGLVCGDATLGGGGHAEAILSARPNVALYFGVDRDAEARLAAKARLAPFASRVRIEAGCFSALPALLGGRRLNVLLCDLGVSSPQLDQAERGFSFGKKGPLDMRMGDGPTLKEKLERVEEEELANIIYSFGEERASRRVARAILTALPELQTTTDLANVVRKVVRNEGRGIDPATRTFQALRIWVNDELKELDSLLAQSADVLEDDGIAMFISFHSLEDRAVKQHFLHESRDCVCPPRVPQCVCGHRATFALVTKKPIVAGESELGRNPRARSAKLRVVRRLPRGS